MLAALDVTDEQRSRVHSPAGLDIGGRTAAEIALSVLAELVAERRAAERHAPAAGARRRAVDPVCGMTVAAVDSSPHVDRRRRRRRGSAATAAGPPSSQTRPGMPPPPEGLHGRTALRRRGPGRRRRSGRGCRTSRRSPTALDDVDYLADPGLATALFLAVRLPQPLLLEGEPGVGKTEAAKALARVLDTPLFRLQCFEGIDAAEALYEWNHPRQLLGIRLAEARGAPLAEDDLFGRDYLLRRPLLQAIEHPGPRPAVLLLDEIDRADAEFEAFTFEVLAEAAVTVPELGTIRAAHPPVVVLTSNRTRDLHDALTRRCLYHWIDYPTPERVAEIVRRRVPGSAEPLAVAAATAVTRLRSLDLVKPPGHRRGHRLGGGAEPAGADPAGRRRGRGAAGARC